MPKPSGRSHPVTRRRNLGRRLLLGSAVAAPISIVGLWIAVNKVEWLGPLVADGLRAVIGKDAVAELEDIGYGIQDRIYRFIRKDEQPKAYWEVPVATAEPPEPQAELLPEGEAGVTAEPQPAVRAPFRPVDVGPVHQSWSAPGDGQWVPIAVPDLPELPTHLYKTLLHPDKNRSWAELFVVAMSVHEVDLHLVAGTREPEATVESAKSLVRPGTIPAEFHDQVLGAFNGGFKTEHGRYGMALGEVVIVDPLPGICTVASFNDDSMLVASWERVTALGKPMRWWRQTPHCMYEDNVLNERLRAGRSMKWGATLDGETVIRRSAIGIDAAGETIYVGISNHTTAPAIALGMNHAGAVTVAQLDVNFSYPKFVLFERPSAGTERKAVALTQGFEFSDGEFIRKRSPRDFFFITPKSLRQKTAQNP